MLERNRESQGTVSSDHNCWEGKGKSAKNKGEQQKNLASSGGGERGDRCIDTGPRRGSGANMGGGGEH